MRVKRFYEPIMQTDVLFITDSTPKKIEEYLAKKKINTDKMGDFYHTTAGSVSFLDEEKNGRKTREYLVIVEDKKNFYTLLHESAHLTMHILEDRGIPVRTENTEIFAYYQTFWFKKLWRFMNNIEVKLVRKKK